MPEKAKKKTVLILTHCKIKCMGHYHPLQQEFVLRSLYICFIPVNMLNYNSISTLFNLIFCFASFLQEIDALNEIHNFHNDHRRASKQNQK